MTVAQVRQWLGELPGEWDEVEFQGMVGSFPCALKRIVAYREKDGGAVGVVCNPMGTHLPFDDSLQWIESYSTP